MKLDFVTGGALAALAAAIAFAAVPAQAEDRHGNNGWQQSSGNSGESRGDRGQGQRAQGPSGREQRSAPPQRTFTPQARQEQRTYAPQAQAEQRGWQQARSEQRTYTPQARQSQRSWAGNGQRTEGNRTYVDPNRNTTYRDAQRNDSYRGNTHTWRNGDSNTYRDARRGTGQWDRSWRNNNRYDWQRYRSTNRNVYHVGRYYAPYRNYNYRRLNIGFYLDPLFFGPSYWIDDPFYYRLPEAYGPYRWVRYYDDALLVDIYSGEVVDVIYDFFW